MNADYAPKECPVAVSDLGCTRMPQRKRSQRGMSMVELSLVLIVLAVVLAAVYYGFAQNQRRVEIDENVQAITEIVGNLQGNFGKTNTYGQVTTAVAVQSQTIPGVLRVPTTNTALNSYGGLIAVAGLNCPGIAGDVNGCVQIDWPGVPRAQCVELAIGASNGTRRVSVGATVVKPMDLPLVVADLATQCDANVTSNLTFIIGRGA
jgi:prepilin-type N-terminal cleavage/methylation domain-containing protein